MHLQNQLCDEITLVGQQFTLLFLGVLRLLKSFDTQVYFLALQLHSWYVLVVVTIEAISELYRMRTTRPYTNCVPRLSFDPRSPKTSSPLSSCFVSQTVLKVLFLAEPAVSSSSRSAKKVSSSETSTCFGSCWLPFFLFGVVDIQFYEKSRLRSSLEGDPISCNTTVLINQ